MEICLNLLVIISAITFGGILIIAGDLGYTRYRKYVEYKKKKASEKVEGGLTGLMQMAVAAAQIDLIEDEEDKPKFGPVTDPDLLLQLRHYHQHINMYSGKSRQKLSRKPSFNPSDDPNILAGIKNCSIKQRSKRRFKVFSGIGESISESKDHGSHRSVSDGPVVIHSGPIVGSISVADSSPALSSGTMSRVFSFKRSPSFKSSKNFRGLKTSLSMTK